MFHSAALRLTLWYLAIIMLISIFFSVTLYQVSTREIDRGLRHQASFLLQVPSNLPQGLQDFDRLRSTQIQEAREHLQLNLLYFNLVILMAGGIMSYLLARRTLAPIEEALNAQNRFTADASHELRTPLTALKTEIEVALRDKDISSHQAKDLLKSNLEEVDKLRVLADQLLLLAKTDSKSNGLDFKETNINALIKAVIKKLDPMAKDKKITIVLDAPEMAIESDSPSLTNLFSILLDNAIKYSNANSEVTVSIDKKDGHIQVLVKDFGIGIEQESLPHIFERFYRADSARAKAGVGGYGLGLSIAKYIVKKHHGSISVKSILGKETTFTVTLPLKQPKP